MSNGIVTNHIRGFLSHRPKWYAFIAGSGIIIFWRGIWHSADALHNYFDAVAQGSSIDLTTYQWWDGPLSLLVGFVILNFTGTFISSFIGNEIILAGLRGEKQLARRTEAEVKTEVGAIAEIKEELFLLSTKLEELENKIKKQKT